MSNGDTVHDRYNLDSGDSGTPQLAKLMTDTHAPDLLEDLFQKLLKRDKWNTIKNLIHINTQRQNFKFGQ